MKRPIGITILAVIAVVVGIFYLLLALLGAAGSVLEASGIPTTASGVGAAKLAYATISDAILGILSLAFGIGAFRLKGWAWITAIVVLVLYGIRAIVDVVIQGLRIERMVVSGITIMIALLLLWYLFRPNVQVAFGRDALRGGTESGSRSS
ncbi:MAG TPA: hypothetical protein VE990_01855 [Acidimicrobiales bacterium]|nr:hypothetical protein [Acidimicrobiales bacterium]